MKKRKLRVIMAWVLFLTMMLGGLCRGGIGAKADEPPEPDECDRAIEFVSSWILAYYADKNVIQAAIDGSDTTTLNNVKNTLKGYMAKELWAEAHAGANNGAFGSIFYDSGSDSYEKFEAAITINTYYGEGGFGGLPYFDYCIKFLEDNTNPENERKADGMLSILEHPKGFGMMIGDEVHFVNSADADSDGNISLKTDADLKKTEPRAFGNGVCTSVKRVGGNNIRAYQITQEHSGGLGSDATIGGIGCDLLLISTAVEPIKMVGAVNAAPWDYVLAPVFETSSNPASPAVAEIYYGNDGTAGREVSISRDAVIAGGKTVTGVAVDTTKISGSVASIDDSSPLEFKLKSNSHYDRIPLVITYSDESRGYVEIHRIGLEIKEADISGGQCTIMHGSDQSNDYPVTGEKCVTASFYYNTGSTEPTTDHVKLFVTVETTAGVTHQVVERVNNGFVKANQGTDQYVDDFVVWSGGNAAYGQLKSVSAIVYDAGDDDSFGGVRVGSGLGVTWSK